MHKKIRFPGKMIVTETISRKDGFTSMITKFDENQSILQILFAYVDSLTIEGVPPVTGRPPICRKALLKCFFLKTVFQIDSLRKLTRFCINILHFVYLVVYISFLTFLLFHV